MAKPEVAKAATQLSGRAVVLQVNTDQHPELSGRFGVRGIPHFVVLKEGKVIASRSGLARADELVRLAP
jgi:thioredoxin 2